MFACSGRWESWAGLQHGIRLLPRQSILLGMDPSLVLQAPCCQQASGDVFLCAHSKAVYAAHPWVQVCWMSKGPSWRGTCWQGETPPESIEVIGPNGLSPKCVCYIATCLLGRSNFLIVSQLLSLILCHCRNTLAIQTIFCTKNIIL